MEQEGSVLGGGGGRVQREEVVLVRPRLVPCAAKIISEESGDRLPNDSKDTHSTPKGHGGRAHAHVPWMPIIVARQSQRPAITAQLSALEAEACAPPPSADDDRPRAPEAAAGAQAVDRRVLDHVTTREGFPTLQPCFGFASPSPSLSRVLHYAIPYQLWLLVALARPFIRGQLLAHPVSLAARACWRASESRRRRRRRPRQAAVRPGAHVLASG